MSGPLRNMKMAPYISWNKEKLLVKYVVYVLLMDCHCPLMIYLILNCPPDWYELTIIHKLVLTCFGKSQWKKIYLCRLDLVTFCTIAIMIIPPFKNKIGNLILVRTVYRSLWGHVEILISFAMRQFCYYLYYSNWYY